MNKEDKTEDGVYMEAQHLDLARRVRDQGREWTFMRDKYIGEIKEHMVVIRPGGKLDEPQGPEQLAHRGSGPVKGEA